MMQLQELKNAFHIIEDKVKKDQDPNDPAKDSLLKKITKDFNTKS